MAEVCLCYTGDVLTSKIYDLAYYKSVALQAVQAGAHIIGNTTQHHTTQLMLSQLNSTQVKSNGIYCIHPISCRIWLHAPAISVCLSMYLSIYTKPTIFNTEEEE